MKKFFILLLKPLSFIPALCMMYFIFSFSGQSGEQSGALSQKISREIVVVADKALDKNLDETRIQYYTDKLEFPVRNAALMIEYFILALCVSLPLYVYGVRGIWLILLAGLISVGFACTDEFHQSFVDGRGPSRRDVGIDSIGAFIGILFIQITCHGFLHPSDS